MLKNDLLLRTLQAKPVERTPVWLMRQAGRTDPLYQQIRQKDGRPLDELFCDVELSTTISLLPERMGVDAIIMFQDILTPLKSLGIPFYFRPAPQFDEPLTDISQIKKFKKINSQQDFYTVGQLIQSVKTQLNGRLPVLGFAGAPATVALFLMAGQSPSSNLPKLLEFASQRQSFFQELLDRLTEMTVEYLQSQIQNGIDAFQLFESFAESFSDKFYETFALPTHQKIFEALPQTTPSILFAKEWKRLDHLLASGAKVLSIGTSLDLQECYQNIPDDTILQGNVDNVLLKDATTQEVCQAVTNCLQQGRKGRHILNLNHGLLPDTPFENVLQVIETTRQFQNP